MKYRQIKITIKLFSIATCICLGIGLFFSCNSKSPSPLFDYGTKSDSALYYYHQGWQQILDLGQWTLSEQSFRKAIDFDSTFLIGISLVGRISQNHEERVKIYNQLLREKSRVSADERLILDVFISSINLMNAREQKENIPNNLIANHREVVESNFYEFIRKYPDESYIKAEYIEVLHARYGAQIALDSLNQLANTHQLELPFYLSYAALMESELGHFDDASKWLEQLDKTINDPLIPAVPMAYAQYYFEMDSFRLAKKYVDEAVRLDENHLMAKRLQARVGS